MQGIAQKILAEPGKYSIQQLTQAIQAGVLPAYIGVPIIQDKVQQQKQGQMMQQAQAAPAGQPPIAQQVMAEAQGLQALPTNLPQNYAGGGIVAFEEGGPVERYQNKGYVYETPYDRMNRENRENEERARLEREAQAKEMGIMPYGEQMRNLGNALVNAPVTGIKHLVSAPGYGFSGSTVPATTATAAPTTPAAPTTTTNVAPVDTTKPAAPEGRGGIGDLLSGLGLNLGGAGVGGVGGIGGGGMKPPTNDIVDQTKTLIEGFNTRDAARTAENERRVEEARGKVTGKAYEGLEASLRKEAEEFGADKSQAKNMAIFKAGLAMMAGTSRNALENIGKGAMVGAEDYQAAAKDIKKAQKENERAMAMVEQARRAESIGDRDQAIARMDKANEHLADRDKFGTSAVVNATGKSAELANDIWKTTVNAQTHLAAADLSGRYHLASGILGSMGKDRNQTIQERRLQLQFEEKNPIADVRSAYAKSIGLAKIPAPGVDKNFDATVNQLYANKFQNFINGTSYSVGAGGGQDPYAGYKLVP